MPLAVESSTIDLDGPLHYLEFPGRHEGPTFVCLHALAAHHGTWMALAPLLAERGRVLVPDMPGFGLSPLASRRATLAGHGQILDRFLEATTDGPVVLVGNSMGGASAFLHALREPARVQAMVLLAPAIAATRVFMIDPRFIGLFAATVGPTRALQAAAHALLAITPERYVVEMMRACTADPTRVPQEVIDASIEIARTRLQHTSENVAAFVQAARSVTRFVLRPRRYLAMAREIQTRALLLLGDKDRLVPPLLAEPIIGARPDWVLEVMNGVGHMPQIEAPATVAERIDAFLGDTRAAATTRAVAG